MKPHKQRSATPKPPAMSVEEELAELLADPTLRPSITFLGLRSHTETVPDTDSVSGTESDQPIILYRQNKNKIELVSDTEAVSGTTSVSDTQTVSDTSSVSDTVPVPVKTSVFGIPKRTFSPPKPEVEIPKPRVAPPRKPKAKGVPRYERPKPALARQVQDGHSHSEHAMYTTLWDAGEPFSHEARVFTMGFGAMSRIVRLSLNNCRLNIRSLIRKLAVEEVKAAECEKKIGKTYLIYNSNAILRRRKSAGFEWVIRTRGVAFVDPKTGLPLLPEEDDSVSDTASVSDTNSVSGTNSVSDTVSIPASGTETVGVLIK
jgi:hypothetical protein